MDWCCWENEMVISKDKWIFIFNVNLCVCIYNEKFNVRECFICTKHKNSYVIRWCWSLISYLPSVWLFVFLLWIATSKIDNFTVTDGTVSFGFQGEALGSISDVSLLEIVTKARGRPNGYRKVMKVKWFCHRCLNIWWVNFCANPTAVIYLSFLSRDASVCILESMMRDRMSALQVIFLWLIIFNGDGWPPVVFTLIYMFSDFHRRAIYTSSYNFAQLATS